jgi:hypothetical protein
VGKAMPSVVRLHKENAPKYVATITEVAKEKFSTTNWIVRNAFLICFKELLKQNSGYDFAVFAL